MTRLPLYLLGFLCLQLVFASVIYWQRNQQSELHPVEPLLSFDQQKLDKIIIMAPDQTATLVNTGGHWVLPDLDGLAVNQTQLDTAVEKLAALKTHWPIATTASSHHRFELKEENFQRRIQLFQGDNKVADLLLGSSPSFRKVYLRVFGDDNVYALPLNTFDFPAKEAQWLDKALNESETETKTGTDAASEPVSSDG